MINSSSEHSHTDHHDIEKQVYDRTIFGFWLYVMTDCVLFATLFATYAVLHHGTFGGPTSKDLFELPFALTETIILLLSSFTCGLALISAHHQRKGYSILFLSLTFLLGISFLGMELHEFTSFVHAGNSWQRSAFLSSFFTLVGTHGLHITCGLLWILVMIGLIAFRGLVPSTIRRLACFGIFWHFLDVVWVFIFSFVYLLGAK